MKQIHATVIGFLAASFLPAAFPAVASPLSGYRDLVSIVGSFVIIYCFTAASTAYLGIPAFLLLAKLSLITWWSAVGSGALIGCISLVAVTSGNTDAAALIKFSLLGGASGLVFWLVWRAGKIMAVEGAEHP